jgi:VWFA-related protein
MKGFFPAPLAALKGCATTAVFAVAVSLSAQQQPAPRIAVRATTVAVDVVVRDKNGRPVTDLAPADFEVYEDGVRQEITSFWIVAPDRTSETTATPARPAAQAGVPAAAAPLAGPAVVALVFDRLSPESRALAQKAALTYVDEGHAAGDFTGVFLIDTTLHTIRSYTRDVNELRQAVERAAVTATTSFPSAADTNSESARARAILYGNAAAGDIAGAESRGSGVVNVQDATRPPGQEGASLGAGDAIDRRLAELQVRMDDAFEALGRDQQGHATTNGLLSVVHSLQGMPGRKTVIFFSEGVAIPPAVEHQFQYVIEAANRANVAIYTLDASGLRVRSALSETRRKMTEGMANIEKNRDAGIMSKGMEQNEDLLRLNPESSLGMLANETGGLLFQNTNDLRTGMRRIDTDRHFYYLLTYSPKNEDFDGRFRQIAVKLRRPGVDVHARKGYRAVRSAGPVPVLSYEAPALALLDSAQGPNAFAVQAGALTFPEPKRPGLAPVVVQVRTDALTFREDRARKRYATDFSIVVRLKDRNEQVLRKLSQRYELSGPLNQLETAKLGEVLFYREPELAPGVYTLEAIVYDAVAAKASARVSTLEVHPPGDPSGVRVSSLMIVRRSERVPAAERNAANPLFYGDVVLYPNLGEPLQKGTDKELTFAATIYPSATPGALQASLELLQNGTPLGQAPVQLPQLDASGRVQYVGRLPVEGLAPGVYELRLLVTDGKTRQARSAAFRIE